MTTGDIVRCIKNDDTFDTLKVGKLYRVEEMPNSFFMYEENFIKLVGIDSYIYSTDIFKVVDTTDLSELEKTLLE